MKPLPIIHVTQGSKCRLAKYIACVGRMAQNVIRPRLAGKTRHNLTHLWHFCMGMGFFKMLHPFVPMQTGGGGVQLENG